MKLLSLGVLLVALPVAMQAQERVWRCGNEYTNNPAMTKRRDCQLLEGGQVTVMQSARPAAVPPAAARSAAAPRTETSGARVDDVEQRARDNDARGVLEAELRKAEARRAELLRDYNNGEPEKQGSESRNHQKYLDRVAEMKADIARTDSDIAGIRRELGRFQVKQ